MTDYNYGDGDRPDPADWFTLDDGKVIKLEEALGADHTATGFTITDAITATKPSTIGDCIRGIGHAHATNIVCFNPDLMVIKL